MTDPDGEIARLVRHHDCGAVVAPGDDSGLAQAITTLAAAPERCREMGDNARAMLVAHYTRRTSIGRWDELLRTVPG